MGIEFQSCNRKPCRDLLSKSVHAANRATQHTHTCELMGLSLCSFFNTVKKSGWINKMGDERVEKIKVDSSHETRV